MVTRELRKLHLRWWHAKEHKMRAILSAAGIDETRLGLIGPIVDTCRECRAWQRPGDRNTVTVEITTKFNDKGETDLFYYKRHIAFHIMDRAIKFSDGCEIPNKFKEDLMEAYMTTWYQRYGPFKELYTDGEMGWNNSAAIAELEQLGTKLQVRAKGQHANTVEARNAMLRHVMHMIEESLKRHNAEPISFPRLYAEALFVVNSFSFYNGVSPYNALTGRQPACLPELENIDFPKEGQPGAIVPGERERRIREVSIEAITQSTAVAKINRALKAKTTAGGKLFKIGDLVDFHRPTATKDDHGGWNGPYPVTKNEPERGRLICNHGNREIIVKYADARLTLFIAQIYAMELANDTDAMDLIIDYIGNLAHNKMPETFGYAVDKKGDAFSFHLTSASKRAPKIYMALQYLVRNFFRIESVVAIRLGKGVRSVGKFHYADRSTLVYYSSDTDPDFRYYETDDTALDVLKITQNPNARMIQLLCQDNASTTVEEISDITRELLPSPDDRRSNGDDNIPDEEPPDESQGPPTPIDMGGELPTIHEDDHEATIDELITETFYAELLEQRELQEDLEFYTMYPDRTPMPIQMMPQDTTLFMAQEDDDLHGNLPDPNTSLDSVETLIYYNDEIPEAETEEDDVGSYIELCFSKDMAQIILSEADLNNMKPQDQATMRVYISEKSKRAVVVKDDDLLSKAELLQYWKEVSEATIAELKCWLSHNCFKLCLFIHARNVMTSRYVAKWKWVKDKVTGKMSRVIRMRLCLRGFMDTEAFSIDTFSGTAKRTSQRILASEAACHPDWIIASLDIDKAFLQGFTYKELAEATGEQERIVCFKLPPGSAALLRKFPGFENFDETIHCLQCIKPGTGTKDAPRAFSLKLRKTTWATGLRGTSYDPEFEVKKDLLTAKHVDDVNMGGKEPMIDGYTEVVEKVFGKCKLNKHQFTNCGVQYTMDKDHNVIMDQDDYIKTLRPIVSTELTGASAEALATKTVADQFVSLRGALAYTTLTQAWIQVYIVALQRVQEPTNLDVRRLNAITRKLQKDPQKLIFVGMKCSDTVDIHTDSGYRRMDTTEDVKGYGIRGCVVLRKGLKFKTNEPAVHLLDSICKSHRLVIRSSYGAELLAATHGCEDAMPSLYALVEIKHGVMTPTALKDIREKGGLQLKVILTIDAESVYKSLTSRDLKAPTEKTLLGHVAWIRELLTHGIITTMQWCDTRDMAADGHTKGIIDRQGLLDVMKGQFKYKHDVKSYAPHRDIQR